MEEYTYYLDEKGLLYVYLKDGRLVATLPDVHSDMAEQLACEIIEEYTNAPFTIEERGEEEQDMLGYLAVTLSSNAQYDGHDFEYGDTSSDSVVFTVDGRKFKLLEIK